MATTSIQNKKKINDRLALLGLSTDQLESCGPCPSSEELATLVQHPQTMEDRDRLFSHLAGCDRCYQEWLALHEIARQDQRPDHKLIRFPVMPAKVVAAVGSTLAIAASVALFLLTPYRQDDKHPVAPLFKESARMADHIAEEPGRQNEPALPEEKETTSAASEKEPPLHLREAREPPSPRYLAEERSGAQGEKTGKAVGKRPTTPAPMVAPPDQSARTHEKDTTPLAEANRSARMAAPQSQETLMQFVPQPAIPRQQPSSFADTIGQLRDYCTPPDGQRLTGPDRLQRFAALLAKAEVTSEQETELRNQLLPLLTAAQQNTAQDAAEICARIHHLLERP